MSFRPSAAAVSYTHLIGGFSALVQKGATAADLRLMRAIPQALSETDIVCSSVNVASTRAGINMDAVRMVGEIIKETAELTRDKDGFCLLYTSRCV